MTDTIEVFLDRNGQTGVPGRCCHIRRPGQSSIFEYADAWHSRTDAFAPGANLLGGLWVTGDTALRLGRFFGTSGEFWLNLQKFCELRLAERKDGAAIARLPSLDCGDRPRTSD